MKLYLPADASARALGADQIAAALRAEAEARQIPLTLIRNGSRGMSWLEPLLECETPEGRIAFGPFELTDVQGFFDTPERHPKALGRTDALPWMVAQTRLTFARVGVIDPLCLQDYAAHGGLAGLRRALALGPEASLEEVTRSGLRGRGGAGFPTGVKWRTVQGAEAAQKYIVCNADEGDSATFADRMLIEGDPFALIEGMAIAGLTVGATQGYIYLRSEYPDAIRQMAAALHIAQDAGLLGPNLLGSSHPFEIELRVGAGAYVCGEETSLLNSLEGKRGTVRAKPPLPALQGFMGRPTVVNNVLTLATVPMILAQGGDHYASFGMGRSRGTMALQIAGNVARGGLFEAAFGLSLGEIVQQIGGGTDSGRPVKAVQVGGPLGAWFPPSLFDTPFTYEDFAAAGGLIGHAGLSIADDTADMGQFARFAMEFCAIESCGKCTPCRIGARRGIETIDRLRAGDPAAQDLLLDLCETMKAGSLCALGGFTPYPVLSALRHFPQDFAPRHREAAE